MLTKRGVESDALLLRAMDGLKTVGKKIQQRGWAGGGGMGGENH